MKFVLLSTGYLVSALKLNVETSACNRAEKYFGVECEKSLVQFASGMNGDEDLG